MSRQTPYSRWYGNIAAGKETGGCQRERTARHEEHCMRHRYNQCSEYRERQRGERKKYQTEAEREAAERCSGPGAEEGVS